MFVHKAELLVGDDPSSALDLETASLLWLRLFAHEEVTMLAISQGISWRFTTTDARIKLKHLYLAIK